MTQKSEKTELKQGPYGLVGETGRPMCEECDIEMNPFSGEEGAEYVEGYGCDGCGWSFDTCREKVRPR